VALGTRAGEFVLTVADNGAGYDPQHVTSGMGLPGMRSRAEESGGSLSIESRPGGGTVVRFVVPVISVPTTELGRMALWNLAGIGVCLLLSIKLGPVALIALPLPVLEFTRLSIACDARAA